MGYATEQLVWVTPSLALNPAQILEVFHGRGGQVEVHFVGRTCQLQEADLTDEGRALLLPPRTAFAAAGPRHQEASPLRS
jgi:hypothetical protein